MKNPESFQEQKKEITLTPEQAAHNPNGFWEHFFEQNREQLLKVFEKNADPEGAAAKEVIKDALHGLKKKKEFTSEEELLRRGLEYYAEKNGGFGESKGLEDKYKELRESKRRKFAERAAEGMKEMEYDEAGGAIEDAVKKLLEEEPDISHEEVVEFRNTLWELFEAKKRPE